jgi:sterol desaturase/sphingolipid hydroxylase (fatty acid hydroxylase superfamily)
MGLEYLYSVFKKKNLFHFAESVANINVGIAERLTDIFTVIPFFYFFQYIYVHYAAFVIRPGVATWILLFLLTDLVWYWYHRFAHEINILWAAHIVHHQSEDFNYTASARITVFQAIIRCLFWGVLALIGFPPQMITALLLVHGIYPFFIHTQTVGKLGWIEFLFVTPSHHRVHHSSNPEYLDKNYGDVLIIWDKIFGTFAEEKAPPVYGLTKPLGSYSFLWQHFHYPLELMLAIRKTQSFSGKIKILFGSPSTLNPELRMVLEKFFLKNRSYLNPTKSHKRYILLQTILSLCLLFCLIFFYDQLTPTRIFLISAFIMLSLVNTGAILEQRSWIFYLEFARLTLLLLWIWAFYPNYISAIMLSGIVLTMLWYFKPIEKRYKRMLFAQPAG